MVVYNKIIPFPGFMAMNFFGIIFVREDMKPFFTRHDENHENIHTAQMKDFCPFIPLGGIVFYIVYIFEWLIKLFKYGSEAYDNISFEKEAYANQMNPEYLKTRQHFAQWKKQTNQTE